MPGDRPLSDRANGDRSAPHGAGHGPVRSSGDASRLGATANQAPLVESRGLQLYAGGRLLVDALDWCCLAGERWCIIGRNAVGKTTLLRALAGLPVPRRAGVVAWQGRDQTQWPADAAAGARALMAQQPQDRFSLPVRRLIDLSARHGGTVQRAMASEALSASPVEPIRDVLLQALDIEHLQGSDVMRLSGGERQRVALAQCAVQAAPLMLLDEPVAFQDPAHQLQVARWIVAASSGPSQTGFHSPGPCAFIVTAHDMNWIARVATHVLALQGDGSWRAGPAERMLTPRVLEQVFGCKWHRVGNSLFADDE